MKIYLGADHGGFELKEKVAQWLAEWGYQFEDVGAHQLDPTDDYPQYAFAVAEKVAEEPDALGVLLCRSGAGVSVSANKVRGARATQGYSSDQVAFDRDHDNINIITLAGNWLTEDEAKKILHTFLTTSYSQAERHQRRLAQIAAYEGRS